jgi:hypothetical protein
MGIKKAYEILIDCSFDDHKCNSTDFYLVIRCDVKTLLLVPSKQLFLAFTMALRLQLYANMYEQLLFTIKIAL